MTEPPKSCGRVDCDERENCDWPTCVGYVDLDSPSLLPGEMENCTRCVVVRQQAKYVNDIKAQKFLHIILHREGPSIVPLSEVRIAHRE